MSQPRTVFPDTTVLVNFALVDRMDLLQALVGQNGCWCASVADECKRQARSMDLPQMLRSDSIFGDPMRMVTRAEYIDYKVNRDWFASVSSDLHAGHEGEAETLAIIVHNKQLSLFVTDDTSVPVRVKDLSLDQLVNVCTTWDLLRVALWRGLVSGSEFWEYRRALLDAKRACPEHVRDRDQCARWLVRPS